MFKVLAFLAGLGSACCGLLFLRDLLLFITLQQMPQGSRLALSIAMLGLGLGLSLGLVVHRLRRRC
ncbi:hypothetical protein [Methylobacterium sp. NEAU K]|uniref:hypothetical protein n=1 Tax=Methylobacterium sp. NEAU K TaxID=3064946 RepID=UPI00273470F4|nr:hypothetical protein [Methylobacterium sp. NEAU K]